MKFDLEDEVVIKENGLVGIVINRELEDEWLYTVAYILDKESFCEEFYENELLGYKIKGEIENEKD